jgi:hypothetical protein
LPRPGDQSQPTPESQAIQALSGFLDALLARYAEQLNQSTDKRLAFFALLFGAVSGLAMKRGLSPPQAHAVSLALFQKGLGMSPPDSARFAQFGIDATSSRSPWNYAAHAGIEEFFAWEQDPARYEPKTVQWALDRAPASAP